jgi:lysophospholipase L1-like esterase
MRLLTILALVMLGATNAYPHDPITVYLAGDSTMAQKLPEKRPETGWGEALQKYFDEGKVRIENHAQNGRSTRTFISENRWQAIVDNLRKGDYVFIQFGHNDEAREKVDRYTPPEDYRRNLIKFISEVRAKKATPVLLTPVMRRRFDAQGNFFDTHGEYPDIVRRVAADYDVELIDLHRQSERVLRYYGPEATKKLFLQLPPNQNPNYPKGIEDNTHFSPAGAEAMASLVVAAMRAQKLSLAKYLKESKKDEPSLRQIVWRVNALDKIGGLRAAPLGNPEVVSGPGGKSVQFDGVDDGLVVKSNPLAGATTFTLEAVFRPDAGGAFEQRWFHIQEEANDSRVLLEIRLTGDHWFLDTFIKSGEEKRTLYSENFKHNTGEWYHVALVYDGVTMRDFVNGREEMSGPLAILPLGPGSASIGVRMNRVFWFKGAVSKARFTPRALSPREFMKL